MRFSSLPFELDQTPLLVGRESPARKPVMKLAEILHGLREDRADR